MNITYTIHAYLATANGSAPMQINLLIGWDEGDSQEWFIDEASINGVAADELGLHDWVDTLATDHHGEDISAATAEAAAAEYEQRIDQLLDNRNRAADMKKAL